MVSCCLCNKKGEHKNVTFFEIPKDERRRKIWSEICSIQFSSNSLICADHFFSSDIIKVANKVSLTANAVPCVQPVKCNYQIPEDTHFENHSQQASVWDNAIEYVQIHTTSGEAKQKCRCCSNPRGNFQHLDDFIKTSEEEMDKTYKELLYEITKFCFTTYQEINMPQQICEMCGEQLKISYNFIQRACKVSQQHLAIVEQQSAQEDIKNIAPFQESLIEISAPRVETLHEELKVEPLIMECDIDIKEEKLQYDEFAPMISNNEEPHKESDFLELLQKSNTKDTYSSEDDEDSDEPESVKDINEELNDETLPRSCDICHKVYRNEKLLKIHKHYTHMPDEDKLPCPFCSYKASRTGALKVHVGLVHGQDKVSKYFKSMLDSGKMYPCNLCPRSYGRKDRLRTHVISKHLNETSKEINTQKPKPKDKKRFLCTQCGQSYSSKCGLEDHILTHTGERPFACDICSKTFKRLKDLQLHRVIHSDEKPHQCSQCDKAFKHVDKLKIHMRVHSELRPYKCNECEKTFKYPTVLRTHMHIHTGQTPFACKTCGEAFSLRTSLNNHCLKNGHVK